MRRKILEELLRIHRSQRDYALKKLNDHYPEIEERDEEDQWLDRYLYHKQVVKDLEQEKPDD